MKGTLIIAWNDLRIFLKNRASYFWLFGSPLIFTFFIGMTSQGPGSPSNPRPSIALENRDTGFMGRLLLDELGVSGFNVVKATNLPRGIRIPDGFTRDILAKKPARLELFQMSDSSQDAAAMVELRLTRAVIALNSHLVENSVTGAPMTEANLRAITAKPNPVTLNARFATRKPIPTGYRQSVPGILVMFTMMNLLIFGGVSIASERREGVLRRLVAQPISFRALVFGKIAGLMLLGAVQISFLLVVATFMFGFTAGTNVIALLLVLAVYAAVASALGVFIGSVVAREDKVVAICVLVTMVMAALGGCWWPLEIVPGHVRLAGHLFPTAWAMDALHQLISFGGGLTDIWKPVLVLIIYAAASSFGAVRFFRV